MVYSSDTLNSDNSNSIFNAQTNGSTNRAVVINWTPEGASTPVGLHTITGPTPLLEISTNIERTDNSVVSSTTTSLSLNGTLVNDNTSLGMSGVVSKIKALNSLFGSGCNTGKLSLFCNGAELVNWSGVKVMGSTFDRSSDNWTTTCPYTINLEYVAYATSGFAVRDMTDNWVIEQLDDTFYTRLNRNNDILQQTENHNPKLNINTSPPAPVNGAVATSTKSLDIISVPRFKVSRTISAIGKASGCAPSGINNTGYLEAKRWVENRAKTAWTNISSNASASGLMNLVNSRSDVNSASTAMQAFFNQSNPIKTYIYNYLKTSNANILQGSYEISETFLAMPTGMGYTEDYTIDMSTDDRHIVTVRVEGTINGLSLFVPNVMDDPHISQNNLIDNGVSKISLSGSMKPQTEQQGTSNGIKTLDDQNRTAWNLVSTAKYRNAASGWLNDIKPILYRRACLVTNSKDRNRAYVNPITVPPPPLNNPVYCYQRPVNIVPISTSETHDPRRGSISYAYEFNNQMKIIPGTLFEKVTVDDTLPNDVINEALVLGRALGPVLQRLGTVTSAHKSVTVEVGVVPPSSIASCKMQNRGCPLWIHGDTYRQISAIISGFQPFAAITSPLFLGSPDNGQRGAMPGKVFIESDVHNWNASQGRFSRTVKWIYQRCQADINRPVLSH